MKFVSIRDLRLRGGAVWKALEEGEEAILTSNGKPVALLAGISEEQVEEVVRAFRRARAQAAVTKMREMAVKHGLDRLSQEDIETEIRAARRERSR